MTAHTPAHRTYARLSRDGRRVLDRWCPTCQRRVSA